MPSTVAVTARAPAAAEARASRATWAEMAAFSETCWIETAISSTAVLVSPMRAACCSAARASTPVVARIPSVEALTWRVARLTRPMIWRSSAIM